MAEDLLRTSGTMRFLVIQLRLHGTTPFQWVWIYNGLTISPERGDLD